VCAVRTPSDPDRIWHEVALDEAALAQGRLYEIHDPVTGRVLGVRETLAGAFTDARPIGETLAAETAVQLAINGEGHREFSVRVHVRDQDTGAHLAALGLVLPTAPPGF
jgi:hypothetical protein